MDVETFCNAFIHVERTPEAKLDAFCMCKTRPCLRKNVTCVMKLVSENGKMLFEGVYHNKFNHIKRKAFLHAEDFALKDAYRFKNISNVSKMMLYLTYNPCHFSGGHSGICSAKSCTDNLIQFSKNYSNICIEVKISYTYRVHWTLLKCNCADCEPAPEKYRPMIRQSQIGLHKIAMNNIKVSSFDPDDYEYLLRFANDIVKSQWEVEKHSILKKRSIVDEFVQSVIDKYAQQIENTSMWTCTLCQDTTDADSL